MTNLQVYIQRTQERISDLEAYRLRVDSSRVWLIDKLIEDNSKLLNTLFVKVGN
jgi:hypothetical protein